MPLTDHIVQKIDRSYETPKTAFYPGKNSVVEISDAVFKQAISLYCAEECSVGFITYNANEMNFVDSIKRNDLIKSKKPGLFGCASKGFILQDEYKHNDLAKNIIQQKIKKDDEFSVIFCLQIIKNAFAREPFNALQISMCRGGEFEIDFLPILLQKCILPCSLQVSVPILRLFTTLDNPVLQEYFYYDCLIYITTDQSKLHKLTKKMLDSSYLCLRAKFTNIEELKNFKGWGLHIMTVKENGLDLSFISKEIQSWCNGRAVSRKLTALTRSLPDEDPWLLDGKDLQSILTTFEEAKIDFWLSVDVKFINRVYTKPNGEQAALVVETTDDHKYSSIVFIQPYDIATYKFIIGGHNTYFK